MFPKQGICNLQSSRFCCSGERCVGGMRDKRLFLEIKCQIRFVFKSRLLSHCAALSVLTVSMDVTERKKISSIRAESKGILWPTGVRNLLCNKHTRAWQRRQSLESRRISLVADLAPRTFVQISSYHPLTTISLTHASTSAWGRY